VGGLLIAWSLLLALCALVVSAGFPTAHRFIVIGALATVVAGMILGVRGRSGLAFAAPLLSATVAWPAMMVGFCIRSGLFPGFLYGVLSIVYFFAIGPLEWCTLVLGAGIGRLFRRTKRADVEILPPTR
jgi:hypothetical protein